MKKIILVVFILVSMLTYVNASSKGNCLLSQKGDFKVEIDNIEVKSKVKYISIIEKGESFRSILVGSYLSFTTEDNKKIEIKITDIKADPRVKKKPRTGYITVDIKINNKKTTTPLKYSFKNGIFNASGKVDNLNINITTDIEAILCSS
ncbi:MAG: hypothetical protein L3J10_09415 [Sulfurimonas sp.]|nr:hypothetical protein [Sulfurimonas sp.]